MKRTQLYYAVALAFLLQLTALLASAQEPVVAYMTLTGNRSGEIKGSSTLKGTEGAIECVGYSYSLKNSVSIGSQSSGAGAGKASPVAFQIVKHYDNTSPALMQAMTGGEMLTGTIQIYKRGGDQTSLVQKIEFSGAAITGITQYAGIGSGRSNITPDEELTITALKVESTSSTQAANGAVKTGPAVKYDIKANKKQ